MKTPCISIIIPTCNRALHLRPTLQSLAHIDIPASYNVELLVADNGSDQTPQVLEECRKLLEDNRIKPRYLHIPQPGCSHARNEAIKETRGEIIFVVDDDMRLPHNWVEAPSRPILAGEADAVAAGVRLAPHLARPWMTPLQRAWFTSTEMDKAQPPGTEPGRMIGGNMIFARRVLEKIPQFDVELGPGTLGFCDDILFSLQLKEAGYKIAPMWQVESEHHFDASRLSYDALLERARCEGRSTAYLWYHWLHLPVPLPRAKLLYFALKLAAGRKTFKAHRPDGEGCSEAEMVLEQKLACYRQYLIEMKRPRNYEMRGLRKIKKL